MYYDFFPAKFFWLLKYLSIFLDLSQQYSPDGKVSWIKAAGIPKIHNLYLVKYLHKVKENFLCYTRLFHCLLRNHVSFWKYPLCGGESAGADGPPGDSPHRSISFRRERERERGGGGLRRNLVFRNSHGHFQHDDRNINSSRGEKDTFTALRMLVFHVFATQLDNSTANASLFSS